MSNNLTVLDLFAGIGGLSLGFEMVGAFPIAAVESNLNHALAYSANRPFPVKVVTTPISELDVSDFAREVGIRRRQLDLIVGGPPCQPFSSAGKRNGTADDRGTLVGDFVRFVKEPEPRAFVMENVVGLRSIHDGVYFKSVLRRLAAAGYRCEWYVLDAADYGVPQRRRRLFVVGSRLDWIDLSRPTPTHGLVGQESLVKPYVTVRDAISDLPSVRDLFETVDDQSLLPYFQKPNQYQRFLRERKRTVNGNGMTIHHPHILEAIDVDRLGPGQMHESTRYRRLYWDAPSTTLRAGSGSFTALRPIHPSEPRVITVREAARLQSFPDRFAFAVQRKFAHQQIGNSVPPLLARALAEKLVLSLSGGRTRT